MNMRHTCRSRKYLVIACKILGLISTAGLLMAQAESQLQVQITGQKTAVMPKSNATRDMLTAASAAAPAAQGDPTFGNGPAPGPLGPGPGCNLFPAPPSTGASCPCRILALRHLPAIPAWWVRSSFCNRAKSM